MTARMLIVGLIAAALLVPASAQARTPALHKCGFHRVHTETVDGIPVGKVRTRGITCLAASVTISDWFTRFYARGSKGQQVRSSTPPAPRA
jgi:hypothetical protein